jgi:predicted unusual protein kinase regulating ubiquinone biosynthesis (AarF/ABC1/UbiB family)
MLLSPAHIPRLAAIVGLFTRYGLRDVAQQQGLLALVDDEQELSSDELVNRETHAAEFRKRLVELGPAYVKLGQVLSTRPDLLPAPYIRELESLQDDVGPISIEEVEQTIESELGARISKLFQFFDPEPLGSASLGQVHGARLREGREVVVKVQRPRIRASLAEDIEFFKELARFMEAHTAVGSRVDIVGVIQQLERALADELDYRVEARSAAAFRRSLAGFPRLIVPRVIDAYSSERVLTTERVRGVKVHQVSPIARLEHDFHPVAEELTRAYLKGITIDGFFHADPHPGNVFVAMPGTRNPMTPAEIVDADRRSETRTPANPVAAREAQAQEAAARLPRDIDVRLALIDFGMTARLSIAMRDAATRLLMAVGDHRGDEVASTLIEIGQPRENFDRIAYTGEVSTIIARNIELTAAEMQTGRVLFDVLDVSYKNGLRLPAEMTLLAKALFSLDGVTRALDPDYTPIDTIRAFSNEIAVSRAQRDISPGRIYRLAVESSDLVAALPHRLDKITQKLANDDLGLVLDVPEIPSLIVALQKVANRIFSGLVLAGLLVASAMLLQYWKVLGTVGFVVAAVLGLYMVLMIIMSDRRKNPP